MRKFSYWEYDEGRSDFKVVLTEDEILAQYYPYWKSKMVKKFGGDHPLITNENCIMDWVVMNWASEVKYAG